MKITKPAIRRLARTAGAARLSGLIYEEIRGIMLIYLQKLISTAVHSTIYSKRKTVSIKDVEFSLKELGLSYGGIVSKSCAMKPKSKKTGDHRYRPGTQAFREIKHYQKNSDCLIFPVSVFKKLVQAIIKESKEGFRVTEQAKNAIQIVTEVYLKDLIKSAVKVALSDKSRQTLKPKDLQTVRQILNQRA